MLAMNESDLKAAIEKRVMEAKKKDYKIWTIGVTEKPDQRWTQQGKPKHWIHWEADSESIARSVEKYFLDKGMKGDTGGGDKPTYVYIF